MSIAGRFETSQWSLAHHPKTNVLHHEHGRVQFPFVPGRLYHWLPPPGQQVCRFVGTLMGLVSFPCITMWSTFADAIGRHKLILSSITFGSVICFEMLFFFFENQALRLIYSMTFLVLYSAFLAGMQPLLDFEALELLSSKAGFSKEIYGRQRLWGTIAYSCVTLGGAYLIKLFDGFGVLAFVMPSAAIVFVITLYFTALPDRPKPIFARARARALARQQQAQEQQEYLEQKNKINGSRELGYIWTTRKF